MITYLLKSATCLAVLLVFYHFVLEREKIHNFNRFYLLGSIVFSFLAPLYTFYIEIPAKPINETTFIINNINETVSSTNNIEQINYWNIALYLSLFVSLILGVRFLINLYKIYRKATQNTKVKLTNATLVLVDDAISPHTFWNLIFINKKEYELQQIENELFTHELTHVIQKHTLDVLIIEFLKIVFWFNPLFYILKKYIQLNHEFIADDKVIRDYKNISEYQYLLLNKAAWNNDYYLASNLNYSLTKKRLVMMTTKTSTVNSWLKKLAVIPLLTGSVFVFAERVETEGKIDDSNFIDSSVKELKTSNNTVLLEDINNKLKNINSLKLSIVNDTLKSDLYTEYANRNTYVTYTDKKTGKKVKKSYNNLTAEEKKRFKTITPPLKFTKKTPTKELLSKLKDSEKYAIWIDGKHVNNNKLNKFTHKDFAYCSGSFVYKNARSKKFPQLYQYHLETTKYFNSQNNQREKEFKNWAKKRTKKKNSKWKTVKYFKNDTIITPLPSKRVKKGEQSNIPPPAPKTGFYEENGLKLYYVKNEKGITYYNRYGQRVTKTGKIINPEQTSSRNVLPNQNIEKVYKNGKVVVSFKGDNIPPPPPPKQEQGFVIPPPPPIKSATHYAQLNKNAIFYFNNKKVSYNKVLKSLKNKKGVSVITQDDKGRRVIKFTYDKNNKKTVSIDKINDLTNDEIIALSNKSINNKNVTYYLSKKKVSKSELDKMKPNEIKTVYVKRKDNNAGEIHITSK